MISLIVDCTVSYIECTHCHLHCICFYTKFQIFKSSFVQNFCDIVRIMKIKS